MQEEEADSFREELVGGDKEAEDKMLGKWTQPHSYSTRYIFIVIIRQRIELIRLFVSLNYKSCTYRIHQNVRSGQLEMLCSFPGNGSEAPSPSSSLFPNNQRRRRRRGKKRRMQIKWREGGNWKCRANIADVPIVCYHTGGEMKETHVFDTP